MKLIKPSATLIQEENPFIKIERVGRLCYKSESEYTEETGKKFFSSLTARGHVAMVEHATFVFEVNEMLWIRCKECKYLNCTDTIIGQKNRNLVSGNLRALNEADIGKIKSYYNKYSREQANLLLIKLATEIDPLLCYGDKRLFEPERKPCSCYTARLVNISSYTDLTEEEKLAHTYHTLHLVCDRGITHELVRHRPCSFAQNSTRYCNYSKDKYGNELTFIEPFWINESSKEAQMAYYRALEESEAAYLRLLNDGWPPERARSVLPNSLKTEIIMTTNLSEWNHIFDLRYFEKTGKAHPQMKELMSLAYPLIYSEGRQLK